VGFFFGGELVKSSETEKFQKGFNVRSYGILIHNDSILISHEKFPDKTLVKFPGGGIEFKEGPALAIKREMSEEAGLNVTVGPIFYISPNFHKSYFRPQQLIALYWRIFPANLKNVPIEFAELDNGTMKQRLLWHPLQQLKTQDLTTAIDQEVISMILDKVAHGTQF